MGFSPLVRYASRMWERYYRRSDKQRIAECFAADPAPGLTDLVPDYNVAPTTLQPVIRNSRHGAVRELLLMRWGLVPFFAKSVADFKDFSTFNAKAETVTTQTPGASRSSMDAAALFPPTVSTNGWCSGRRRSSLAPLPLARSAPLPSPTFGMPGTTRRQTNGELHHSDYYA
jgi:hypothetical protein